MSNLKEVKEVYNKVFKVLNKHKDIIKINIKDLEYNSKLHIFELELKEVYGLNIPNNYISSLDYNKLNDYICIGNYGEKYNRTISWSEDGKQPEDEMLLVIKFSTGPYLFGDDYPTELFNKFFLELKEFGPKYIDNANKSLFFTLDNAKNVYNSFNEILNKYNNINKEDIKLRKIAKMKEELAKLENNL